MFWGAGPDLQLKVLRSHWPRGGRGGNLSLLNRRGPGRLGEVAGVLILGGNKRHIGQPDEAENVAEVGLLVVVLRGGGTGTESAATRSEDHQLLPLQHAFCTAGA